ncbi:hypothetical protein Gotri_002457 [Gossypium trilobum]|uniref:Uncharacterized protein n=1 Tax=Gossypium trilobum TaxID=34281 RepID=A0A7J9F8C4_9ROSI|nr:hypothetical protein [Gossypium trilobum]
MEPVDREKQEVHEKVSETSREIANSISCYIRKLEIKEESVVHSRSGSGIVVKNALGKVLVSQSIYMSMLEQFLQPRRSRVHGKYKRLALLLANESLRSGESFYLEDVVPSYAKRTIEVEWVRESD